MSLDDPILQKIARFTPQDILLADVAVRIQLSPTEYETAIKHYEVMGEWIDRPGSPLRGMVDGFYPQGGFSTGSTISAHDDRSDYDLDAMAVINWGPGVDPEYALATLHQAIAGEKGSRYFDKSERKTRCTQVQFSDMHLDVTPSVLIASMDPKTSFIFHSKPSDPSVPRQRLFANPFGLAEWFNARTQADNVFGSYFEQASLNYARASALAKADTTPVPDQLPAYKKSRQVICLQLIKRWRNIVYDRNHPTLRLPPSVLLTYYVGLHTGGERSLLDELIHQVNGIITMSSSPKFGQ
ncbi:nucleotidyltransferase [Paracoccus sanguinis]|uniref:nucleotidyltransferase domain-containing protein n=1 Tax=Paracoccus sanguinis TaxID=1545044 RepID=UPI0018CFBE0F|nr:nucleotidyltransferase [Paracoccus sanguinis]